MDCPECGSENEESYKFCQVCEAELKKTDSASKETESEETFDKINSTQFTITNNITGEEKVVEVNKRTFTSPILFGSGAECDVVLKSTGDSIIFEQHALLGHLGHHTYMRTKRDSDGKIPADVDKYGHFAKYEEGDSRLVNDWSVVGHYIEIGHYTIHIY